MSRAEGHFLLTVAAISIGVLALLAAVVLGAQGQYPVAFRVAIGLGLAGIIGAVVLVWKDARRAERLAQSLSEAMQAAARGDLQTSMQESDDISSTVRTAFEELRASMHADMLSRQYLNRVLAGMNEGILVVAPDGRIERANDASAELLGASIGELEGSEIDTWIVKAATPYARKPGPRPIEGNFKRLDGTTVCVSYTKSELLNESGELEAWVYAAQNIDDRKKVEQRIRYLARTDALTKLPNRMQFQHLMQQAIARAKRSHRYLALLYCDVDRFKDINDTFGHAAGDTSLEMFARRISESIPDSAIPGRLAGDEFCVLLTGDAGIDDLVSKVSETADKLIKAVARPFDVHGEEIFMSTSVGAALYPRDGDNVVDLLRNADAALYRAKKAGGNCYEFYTSEMNSVAEERLKLKSKLRRAFERDELRLHYQPKYRLADGRVSGAEALVRWDLPDHGLVFPSDFIPLAEETNLILQIGEWVLDRVCSDYRKWQRTVPSPCRISVNLSLRQLQQQRFLEGVRRTFRKHSVSPTCLELEITETTLMEDTEATIRILDALYGMGLHLAIDDFGTGYSSLSALQQFPISTLKIDQSFIRDLSIDRDNAAIVRTIIQMAHSLNLEVVAEGVELQEQLDFLRRHHCDTVQGHLFGDPMTAGDFCNLLVADVEGSGRYQALFA